MKKIYFVKTKYGIQAYPSDHEFDLEKYQFIQKSSFLEYLKYQILNFSFYNFFMKAKYLLNKVIKGIKLIPHILMSISSVYREDKNFGSFIIWQVQYWFIYLLIFAISLNTGDNKELAHSIRYIGLILAFIGAELMSVKAFVTNKRIAKVEYKNVLEVIPPKEWSDRLAKTIVANYPKWEDKAYKLTTRDEGLLKDIAKYIELLEINSREHEKVAGDYLKVIEVLNKKES